MFHFAISAAVMQLFVYLSEHRDGLENAAALLGGPDAARRVRALHAAISVPQPRFTRWISRELLALHRLLSLDDVADFDSPAAFHFSLVEPADPVVAEICRLTDGLRDCMRALIIEDLIVVEDFDDAA
jgi:hypothetical protein